MGKVTFFQFVTLDGVTQGPGGPEEDLEGGFTKGGWVVPFFDSTLGQYIDSVFQRAGGFLLGRKTYDSWAAHWPTIQPDSEDYPIAQRFNELPKWVASRTMTSAQATWEPSTLIGADLAAGVRRAADSIEGELQVHGSCTLAKSLMEAGLIDEYRLVVFPVVLGNGRKVFPDSGLPVSLRLLDTQTSPTGVQIQQYAPGEPATFGTHGEEPSR